jgi:uncharacterized BrkB/YihY/UPF0761 family membrane protein
MDWGIIWRFIIFGFMHWLLAFFMLYDLANRKKVLFGKKAIWAVLIIFVFILGSVLYLLCHPQIFFGEDKS